MPRIVPTAQNPKKTKNAEPAPGRDGGECFCPGRETYGKIDKKAQNYPEAKRTKTDQKAQNNCEEATRDLAQHGSRPPPHTAPPQTPTQKTDAPGHVFLVRTFRSQNAQNCWIVVCPAASVSAPSVGLLLVFLLVSHFSLIPNSGA